MPDSVNDILLDRAIMHSHFLNSFSTHEANEVIKFMKRDVIPDIVKQIKTLEGFGIGPARQKRNLQAMREIINAGMTKVFNRQMDGMYLFSKQQANFEAKILGQSIPFKVDIDTPSLSTLKTLVNNSVFSANDPTLKNKTVKQVFNHFNASVRSDINTQLRIGISQGEDVPTLTQRVRGTGAFTGKNLATSLRQAEAVTRTITNHVSTVTREATYKANSDIVKEVQYVATLDTKTTDICMGLDGKTFPIDSGPRPPMHYNCRSTTVPVTKSWKELGIPGLKEAPVGTRRAMNGKVSANVTYGDWLKKQPIENVREALGPARAKLFLNGEVKIDQFTNDRHRSLNLKELAKRENLDLENVPFARV